MLLVMSPSRRSLRVLHTADVHLANPERVLAMARAMGALPPRVAIVGCQPADADELGDALSPVVAGAVDAGVRLVHETVAGWTAA